MRLLPTAHLPSSKRFMASVVTAAALLTACGDGGTTTATPVGGAMLPEGATVEIERSRYAPSEVTIGAGGRVEFVNLDPFDHTVTAAADGNATFDSGTLGQDEVFVQSFEDRGTYRYFCEIHPTMRASVTVE